jgi:hypothetical protein
MSLARRARMAFVVLIIKSISPLMMASTICGWPSITLLMRVHRQSGLSAGMLAGAARGDDFEAHIDQFTRDRHDQFIFIASLTDRKPCRLRQISAGRQLGFAKGLRDIAVDAHDFAGGFHLGPRIGSTPGKRLNGKTGALTAVRDPGHAGQHVIGRG